jgi:hypothetical protein
MPRAITGLERAEIDTFALPDGQILEATLSLRAICDGAVLHLREGGITTHAGIVDFERGTLNPSRHHVIPDLSSTKHGTSVLDLHNILGEVHVLPFPSLLHLGWDWTVTVLIEHLEGLRGPRLRVAAAILVVDKEGVLGLKCRLDMLKSSFIGDGSPLSWWTITSRDNR